MIDFVTIKEVKLKLGELCKSKRQSYDMSQEDLAEAIGLSRYTIQKFENGKNATLDTVLKIANHFALLKQLKKAIDKTIEDENNISLY
ncbi:helix-turn-helix domain-containing protein [Polaribacter ponticola]|uniref:Helix-turn-helix transcriptional regulator n=1 Tax=Polaribacter ponticola TaxID=2978475 RepID=A0ABT5S9K0_9FLAO|nr:helix-turn-helix transcriptional regulator [Polaribacter sp. MSW5]MDD7914784.1 helix-turn-helix transcriptional regulator [Polaribacter sp. MSW5]